MAVGKKITDLTESGSLKDTDLAIVHDGNGTKKSTLTQLSEYMGTKFSNPNLLTNPDFKINQRGSATYTESQGNKKYTVDRWAILKATATKNSDGTFTVSTDKDDGYLTQPLETRLTEDYVITCNVSSVTGNVYLGGGEGLLLKPGINIYHVSPIQEVAIYLKPNSSVKLKWVKLEQGSIATLFVAPNPAEELVKCARFLQIIPEIYFIPYASTRTVFSGNGRYYQSTGGLFLVEMRANPTVTYSNIHKADDEGISEKVTSVDSNKYRIGTIIINNNVDYYTLRMKNIIADAEIY